jgi:hypothetical protein
VVGFGPVDAVGVTYVVLMYKVTCSWKTCILHQNLEQGVVYKCSVGRARRFGSLNLYAHTPLHEYDEINIRVTNEECCYYMGMLFGSNIRSRTMVPLYDVTALASPR